jgi:hypothetical protein
MGMIYKRATNTLIWLGDEEESDPHLAIKALQDVHTRLQLSDATISTEDFERLQIASAEDRSWWAIRQLFLRHWFTRTWTIQEACLSRHCFVQCGKTVFSWDNMAAWCTTLEQTSLLKWLVANEDLDGVYSRMVITDLLLPPRGGETMMELQKSRLFGLTHQGIQQSFLACLVMTRFAAATEPKDKVYGVLGIARSNVKPNYSDKLNYMDVYHQACLKELEDNSFSLPLLSCIDHTEPLRISPSWIPDWNTPRVTQSIGYSSKVWSLYMAGGKLFVGKSKKMPIVLSEDKKMITIHGKIFDHIVTLNAVSKVPILCIDEANLNKNEWANYTGLADNTLSKATYSAPNQSVYNAFFQTLMAGCDGTGAVALSSEHSEVFSLILDSTTSQKPSLPGQMYSIRREKGHFTLQSLVAKKGAKVRRPVQVLEDLRIALRAALHMRRFAVTKRGYFALMPRGTREGGEILVFEKACMPFIVRRFDEHGKNCGVFQLLGETYVHGDHEGRGYGDARPTTARCITCVSMEVARCYDDASMKN